MTLFTRPRRFGKTLNMSMLKSFFEIGADKTLFDGLYISGNKVLCDEHMGKYPVIFFHSRGGGIRVFVSKKNAMYYYRPCDILAYGIAFCRKRCRVVGEEL